MSRLVPLASLISEAELIELRRAREISKALLASLRKLDLDKQEATRAFGTQDAPEASGLVLSRWMHWCACERDRLNTELAAALAQAERQRLRAARAVGRDNALDVLAKRLVSKKSKSYHY